MGGDWLLMLTAINRRIVLTSAAALGSSACVYTFFIFPLIPLLWPDTLNVVQFVSSGVLQLVALPVLAVAGDIQGRRTRQQSQEQHDAIMQILREVHAMHAELHAELDA